MLDNHVIFLLSFWFCLLLCSFGRADLLGHLHMHFCFVYRIFTLSISRAHFLIVFIFQTRSEEKNQIRCNLSPIKYSNRLIRFGNTKRKNTECDLRCQINTKHTSIKTRWLLIIVWRRRKNNLGIVRNKSIEPRKKASWGVEMKLTQWNRFCMVSRWIPRRLFLYSPCLLRYATLKIRM